MIHGTTSIKWKSRLKNMSRRNIWLIEHENNMKKINKEQKKKHGWTLYWKAFFSYSSIHNIGHDKPKTKSIQGRVGHDTIKTIHTIKSSITQYNCLKAIKSPRPKHNPRKQVTEQDPPAVPSAAALHNPPDLHPATPLRPRRYWQEVKKKDSMNLLTTHATQHPAQWTPGRWYKPVFMPFE